MKKSLTIILFIIFLTLCLYPDYSVRADDVYCSEIIQNTDGSYIIVTMMTNTSFCSSNTPRTSYTKTTSRTFTYYSSDNVAKWDVVLTATFIYDNITSSCIASSASYHTYDTTWSCTSLLPGKAGNAAWANFTFVQTVHFITCNTYTGCVSMSCSANGTIS